MNTSRDSGFTLLELAVSLAAGTIIILAVGETWQRSMAAVVDETRALELEQLGQTTIETLEREMLIAKPTAFAAVGAGAPSLTYLIPVDVGEDDNGNLQLDAGEDANGNKKLDLTDGDFNAPDGTVQWGAIESGGARLDVAGSPHRITLSLVRTATVDLGAAGTLQRGNLRYRTSDGRTVDLGRGLVVFNERNASFDIDQDGTPDPLFTIEGEPFIDGDGNGVYSASETFTDTNGNGVWDGRVAFNLWLWRSRRDGQPMLRNYRAVWRLPTED